jgi:deoxycytidylate deaminase
MRAHIALTADENYMDLAILVSRNSICTGGHMGCVLVKDGEILAVATNTPLFQPYASDVHAEVNAVSGCARRGQSTAGTTAYITMPPCKHCFMVLQAAGIHRVVSRHATPLENCIQVLLPKNACRQMSSYRWCLHGCLSLHRRSGAGPIWAFRGV